MANRFEWRDSFNIGVDSIDKEHQQLFKIINKLFAFQEEEKDGQWLCQEGIKFFKGHALKHFGSEERYMESIKYPGLEQHKQIHKSFREYTLPALEEELEKTGYTVDSVEHFLGVCTGWLIGHTLTEDLAITGKGERKWDELLQEDEIEAVRKVIVELVFNMFHLESQMISDAYSGERFGKGIYYHLVYGAENDEKRQEIILVFEEKLLINTVGKIMGLQTGKLDSMLIHATRYTARQFVGRVMEHFPTEENYSLTEEQLLSYEEFKRLFERNTMQASLLFNTGAGYFSYCAISPHLPEADIGTTIEEENALNEVEKYLSRRKEEETISQRKILVVDDSITIRQGMKELLEKDYEVSVAESGIAAIRTITLNKPDLVLLDYEMPVCDGRQTLEMLRSEEAFANLPVIFLTGRSDPESVKKVMSLKPAGYLLKYLKQADIKQKIDAFFQQEKL